MGSSTTEKNHYPIVRGVLIVVVYLKRKKMLLLARIRRKMGNKLRRRYINFQKTKDPIQIASCQKDDMKDVP